MITELLNPIRRFILFLKLIKRCRGQLDPYSNVIIFK